VSEAVDERGEHEHVEHGVQDERRHPGPHAQRETEQAAAEPQPRPAVREDQPVQAVLGDVGGEAAQRLRLPGFAGVVVDVEELHAPEAEQPGAVRIALAVGEGVVLAMDRHPLLPALAGGEP